MTFSRSARWSSRSSSLQYDEKIDDGRWLIVLPCETAGGFEDQPAGRGVRLGVTYTCLADRPRPVRVRSAPAPERG